MSHDVDNENRGEDDDSDGAGDDDQYYRDSREPRRIAALPCWVLSVFF